MNKSTPCGNGVTCRASKKKSSAYSWLPAILIAILPKCPFCIMAYSGAMSLCSGKMLYPHANSSAGYIIVGIALIVLLGIVFNFRGRRTWIAATIAGLGICLLAISQFYYISEVLYYVAVVLLFFGVWFNGSFYYFYDRFINRKIIQPLNSQI